MSLNNCERRPAGTAAIRNSGQQERQREEAFFKKAKPFADSSDSRLLRWPPFLIAAALSIYAASAQASATWPNEPAGFTVLTDQSWDSLGSGGWGHSNRQTQSRIVADATAPLSPNNVLEDVYPIGYTGGSEPAVEWYSLPAAANKEAFTGFWWKPSSPWQGHSSNVNKIFFFLGNNSNIYMAMYGPNGGPYELRVLAEASNPTWITPNVNNVPVTLGQWHKIECYFKQTGSTLAVKFWMDGTLLADQSNVPFTSEARAEYQLASTWGGVGGTKSENDYYRFDHVYISYPSGNPPPPPTTWPNEPAGFTRFAEYDASAEPIIGPTNSASACSSAGVLDGCWWEFDKGTNLAAASDAAAPKSPLGLFQFKYPAGLTPGTEIGILQGWDTPSETTNTEYSEVYESGWVRTVGANFENQAIGTKMLGYWGVGQGNNSNQVPNQVYQVSIGNGSTAVMSSWNIRFVQQNHISRNLPQTAGGAVWTAGVWHRYEVYMKLNDLGSSNGVLKVWWDGTLILNYSDMQYRNASNPSGFYGRRLDPVWGGTGGTNKTRDDFLQYDHLYISGIPLGGAPPPSGSACDMNNDSSTNVNDVQLCVNQAIGTAACGTGDINKDAACNVIDVQRVVNAALGGQCVTQ